MRLILDTDVSARPVAGDELKRLQYFRGISEEDRGEEQNKDGSRWWQATANSKLILLRKLGNP